MVLPMFHATMIASLVNHFPNTSCIVRYTRFPYDVNKSGGWTDETDDCGSNGMVFTIPDFFICIGCASDFLCLFWYCFCGLLLQLLNVEGRRRAQTARVSCMQELCTLEEDRAARDQHMVETGKR